MIWSVRPKTVTTALTLGSQRYRIRFAYWPVRCDKNNVVWMESYYQKQTCVWVVRGGYDEDVVRWRTDGRASLGSRESWTERCKGATARESVYAASQVQARARLLASSASGRGGR